MTPCSRTSMEVEKPSGPRVERDGREKRDGLTVLSWNLWCHLLVGGANASGRLTHFAHVVQQLKPDIVVAQEMFEGRLLVVSATTSLVQLCTTMEVLGYTTVRSRATVPWLYGLDSGLVSFVRQRRVISHDAVVFRQRSQWVSNKGFQWFECDDGLTVFNCHLDATGSSKPAQVEQLCEAVKQVTDAGKAVVVAGDFNICVQPIFDHGELYEFLARQMSQCGLTDSFCDASVVTFPADRACYDHVFTNCVEHKARIVSNRLRKGERPFSDHCGVESMLSRRFGIVLYDEAKHRKQVMDIFAANLTEEWGAYGPEVLQQVAVPYIAHSCSTDLANVAAVYAKFWVCVDREADNQVVGMVGLQRTAPETGELRRMHFRQNFRGQGLGTKLMAALLFFARFNGFKSIELSTPELNKAGMRFYERSGFVRSNKRTPVPGSNGRFQLQGFRILL